MAALGARRGRLVGRPNEAHLAAGLFWRIARHRGEEKAIIAVAHHLLIVIWWMLHEHVAYNEIGDDYLTRRVHPERRKRQLVHHLEQLDVKVTLEPAA